MPRVSVVIPTYNRQAFVTRAVESVLCQTFGDYEIIVVDDGSEDNTKEFMRNYKSSINYIYQKNAGPGAARNTGIRAASGQWLAFLDSDDEWRPDYLEKQMKRVDANSEICMQTTDCLFVGSNGRTRRYFEMNRVLLEFKGRDYLFLEDPFYFIVKHWPPWPMVSTIVRHDTILKAGLFDTALRLSEDFDLMARVALQGPFGLINEVLVNAYRREEAFSSLTIDAKGKPNEVGKYHKRLLEKLKNNDNLKSKEIRALNKLLSDNQRAMGNWHIRFGKLQEARSYYREALSISPSIASLGKYILSYLPAKANLWITEKNLSLKTRKQK